MRSQKYQKNSTFCKESPISKFLGAFIRLTILHQFFKFHVIRITGYRVIAQKAILIVYNSNNINSQCHDNRIILTVCLCYVLQQTTYEDYNAELEENSEYFRDCIEAAETSQHKDTDTDCMQYVQPGVGMIHHFVQILTFILETVIMLPVDQAKRSERKLLIFAITFIIFGLRIKHSHIVFFRQ